MPLNCLGSDDEELRANHNPQGLGSDSPPRGRFYVMGLYRESTLCTSCTSGRISKLMQGEIAPYRTGIANTLCQGPVATGLYMLRS